MKNIWLIPDIEQTGIVMGIENGEKKPINDILDLSTLPKFLTLGIPEELIRGKNDIENFIYGQLYRNPEDKISTLVLSTPAIHKDISGRIIFITNIQIYEKDIHPNLPPEPPQENLVDEETYKSIKHLIQLTKSKSSFKNIRAMLNFARTKKFSSFTSEHLRMAHTPPEWMPKKKLKNYLLAVLSILSIAIAIKILVIK